MTSINVECEVEIEDEIRRLCDDEFEELMEWMLKERASRWKRFSEQPIALKYDPERAYMALLKIRRNEFNDGKWELERAFQ